MDPLQQTIQARAKALEALERAQADLDQANATIARLLGMKSPAESSRRRSLPAARKEHVLTEEGRAKIVAAQRKRWKALRDSAAGRT
jgi:outer membrane protein TolC